MITLDDVAMKVAAAADAGQRKPVDLEGASLPAETLRAMLIGLPVKPPGRGAAQPLRLGSAGVRICNALIDGELELEDGRDDAGRAMPPLWLHCCTLPSPMRLSRARLRHLSLRNSKIVHLDAKDLHLEGSLDLTNLRSAEDPAALTGRAGTPLCWVELQGARIDGGIEAPGAVFSSPADRPDFIPNATPSAFALNLRSAHVRDSVILQPGVTAIGGVGLVGAEVGGDVWASGATLVAGEWSAFNGQLARIGGVLVLRALTTDERDTVPFTTWGDVWLSAAKISGGLMMDGAQLSGSLNVQTAEIGGSVMLPAVFDGQRDGASAIVGFRVSGYVSVLCAKIARDLDMRGADLGGKLVGRGVQIGGCAMFGGADDDWDDGGPAGVMPFVVADEVDLLGADIAGAFSMDGARLGGKLSAGNVKIGGDASFSATRGKSDKAKIHRFTTAEVTNLTGAEIAGKVSLDDADLGGALCLMNAKIGGDLSLLRTRLHAELNARGASIARSLCVDLCKTKPAGAPVIDLQGASADALEDIGGDGFCSGHVLKLEGFRYQRFAPGAPSQSNAVLDAIHGWMARVPPVVWPALFCVAFVTGLVMLGDRSWRPYQTWAWIGALVGLGLWMLHEMQFEAQDWKKRYEWLQRQYEHGVATIADYSPDPFERATRTFRAAGQFNDARHIASRRLTLERKVEASVVLRPLLWFYAKCFDYGLSPPRALLTFILCVVIGWGGVVLADNGFDPSGMPPSLNAVKRILPTIAPALVIETSTVNSEVITDPRANRSVPAIVETDAESASTNEMPCGKQIDPLLYAIDLFVPALDLRQEQRCSVSVDPKFARWRIAKASYAILGWIVTSLAILTLSGILRRQAEG